MSEKERLGERLARENGLGDPGDRERRRRDVLEVVERERAFVRKLGRAAVIAWAGALLMLPSSAVLTIVSQMTLMSSGDATASMGPMIPAVFLGMVGALALVAAIITTIAWLFRSRAATLSAIEARLEELEEEVRGRVD